MLRIDEKSFHCAGLLLFLSIQHPFFNLPVMVPNVSFGKPRLSYLTMGSAWADHTAHIQGLVCDAAWSISRFHPLVLVIGAEEHLTQARQIQSQSECTEKLMGNDPLLPAAETKAGKC